MKILDAITKRLLKNQAAPPLSRDDALARVAAKNIEIATIIDVGAAKGDWSRSARALWPNAHAHLIEAKERWARELETFAREHGPASISLNAASDKPGRIWFPVDGEDYAGAAFKDEDAREGLTQIDATSIDHDVERFRLKGPFALKLDTHGTETDILTGAQNTLKDVHLICIETYNLIGQKRFPQMIAWIEERGFRCADMSDPVFRQTDQTLWQLDFYFLRAEHRAFKDYSFDGRTP